MDNALCLLLEKMHIYKAKICTDDVAVSLYGNNEMMSIDDSDEDSVGAFDTELHESRESIQVAYTPEDIHDTICYYRTPEQEEQLRRKLDRELEQYHRQAPRCNK